jgi:uncharacterized protein (DUF305 family)
MTARPDSLFPQLRRASLCTVLVSLAAAGVAPSLAQVPIIQPGAPGAPARELSADEAIEIADTSYSPADALFMQDMVPHHHQAVEMGALVADRTNRPELIDVAGRIDASQGDEIEVMQQWLRERGERVPDPTAHEAMHTTHTMAGMATPEQMAELAASEGAAFDRLFLQLMIPHHEGAVKMVEELLDQPGSAYDPVLFEFTTEITNGQTAEIERMNALLVGLSADPRAALAPGFEDAGQALLNLELIASLPKPAGFFDPRNPAGLPPKRLQEETDEDTHSGHATHAEDGADEATDDGEQPDDEQPDREKEDDEDEDSRSPLLSFANTDMAFAGDVMVAGNYHGFNIYRLADEGTPELLSSVVCPGGQGDVSIVGDLLIMSVEQTRGRLDCGLEGVNKDVSEERFRGIRILDISDLTRPVQVGAVQTCRGSHTHSVVSGPHMEGKSEDGKIIVYNSGTASIRDDEEMAGCIDETPGDDRTALFRIDIIEIPVDDPAKARIVDSPAVFADPESGVLAGLWKGGDHGEDTQETEQTDQCHDITARATASCSTSPTRRTPSASTRSSTKASPTGTRRPSTTTAARSSSPTNGAAAVGRAAAPTTRSPGARMRSTTSSQPRAGSSSSSAPTTRCRRRSWRRRTAWRTTAPSCRCRAATSSSRPGTRVASQWSTSPTRPTRWRSPTSTADQSMPRI